MLLACAGNPSREAVASLVHVMVAGAVPDTWAPDGSSVRTSCRDQDFGEVFKAQEAVYVNGRQQQELGAKWLQL